LPEPCAGRGQAASRALSTVTAATHTPTFGSSGATMTNRFLQDNLWSEITLLAKRSQHRFVAVAYLGKDATRLLPLRRGDVLVVDMSLSAIKAGQTNPYEIEKYLKRGVEVHSCPNLHAKVFVFDSKAIIGSANVSRNSQNNLVEVALLTTDKAIVNSARAFVISQMGELITPTYTENCKKLFRPSKRVGGGGKRRSNHPRLWIQRLSPLKSSDPNRDKAIACNV